MLQTIEAIVEKDGTVRLLEPVNPPQSMRAVVTLLEPVNTPSVQIQTNDDFDAISLNTKGYRFDREEANER